MGIQTLTEVPREEMPAPTHPLTDEQELVCCANDNLVLVKAYAGCGKTSTLVEYARRRPNERLLYLAFNRAIKEEASRKFPKNVECVTTHGLAYRKYGKPYAVASKLGNPKPFHLASVFEWAANHATKVLDVVNAYLCSSDEKISVKHLEAIGLDPAGEKEKDLVSHAVKAWLAMKDEKESRVPMPHDGYLKLYQLSSPVISAGTILLDEGQDSNALLLDIVMRQKCRKVIVGDTHQSIYMFRGAVNAMEIIPGAKTYRLTASFRFGEGIGKLASVILKHWKKEQHPLIGRGTAETEWFVDRNKPHTILARTNSALFVEAVLALSSGRPFGFVGGVENYAFDLVADAYSLSSGRPELVKDQFLRNFPTWADMVVYAESSDDKELKFLIRNVKEYGSRIPDLVERIKREAREVLKGDEILMTTAHKSKGLEWPSVVLLDDFTDLQVEIDAKTGEVHEPSPDEINLLYVAITRSLRSIHLPEAVLDWLADADEILHSEIMASRRAAFAPMERLPVAAVELVGEPKSDGKFDIALVISKLEAKLPLSDHETQVLVGLLNAVKHAVA